MLPNKHNVVWTTPSKDAAGSMPLGNGSIGINLWVESGGDICFYLSRTDSWGEFGQLYKTGRARLSLTAPDGQPMLPGNGFRWELKLEEGAAEICNDRIQVRIRVDAHHPAVIITANSDGLFTGTVSTEIWRNQRRKLTDPAERHSLHINAPYPVYHEADTVAEAGDGQIAWYHHNRQSTWAASLRQQGLEKLLETETDPLLHRCFGGLIQGAQLTKVSNTTLTSITPVNRFETGIFSHCTQCTDPADWLKEIKNLAGASSAVPDASAWQHHVEWWRSFWERSWIDADGCDTARAVSRGYALQRYMNACSGRGKFPIKFNGSIFTVDWGVEGEDFDADYRRWGPGYWHQNTRLAYWSMLPAGDADLMRPYFEMYRNALPLATERIRRHCGHAGATFTETMWFWGAYLEHNYGWLEPCSEDVPENQRRDPDLPGHLCQNQYIRLHNSSGLEVVYHACLYYRWTEDEGFLDNTLIPLAEAVLDYYDHHYERKNGKLHITPAQVIEQWWEAESPMPEIAGLHACLEELLALPHQSHAQKKRWERLQNELPDLPTGKNGDSRVFHPAESWNGPPQNTENPELYAVFPYHRCHLDGEDLPTGRETFFRREHTHDMGWAQDGMQAALLGLTAQARTSVEKRLTTPSDYVRFSAFWGPGFDWIPDQDQGGSAAHAFQLMAMQVIGSRIHLLPAWPKEWSIDFKLAAPGGCTVSGKKTPEQDLDWQIDGPASSHSFTVVPANGSHE